LIVEALAQPPLVLLGLALVLLEHLLDLGVVGGCDHGVEHRRHVLLHGVGVLDVLDQLLLQLRVGHASYLLVEAPFPFLEDGYSRTPLTKTTGQRDKKLCSVVCARPLPPTFTDSARP
jgi:hypothetical protein